MPLPSTESCGDRFQCLPHLLVRGLIFLAILLPITCFAKKTKFTFKVLDVQVTQAMQGAYLPGLPQTSHTTSAQDVQLNTAPIGNSGMTSTGGTINGTSTTTVTPAASGELGFWSVNVIHVRIQIDGTDEVHTLSCENCTRLTVGDHYEAKVLGQHSGAIHVCVYGYMPITHKRIKERGYYLTE